MTDSFVYSPDTSQRWCVHKDLVHLLVPVADLIPDPANARLHSQKNLSTIGSSVGRFGQRTPLVVQKKGDQLIVRKGNGTLEAARSMGWTHVAALQVVEGDLEATAYAIADNRAGELAHWDDDVLGQLLDSIKHDQDAFEATGFSLQELDLLTREWFTAGENPNDIEDYVEANEKFIIKIADVAFDHREELQQLIQNAIDESEHGGRYVAKIY